ncbi:TPA: hypothetical protein JIZ13_17545 [Acinetobacter nosocomialis]|uniref:Uncharacterized protein n=2 Tax=Acinetobacter nosocomialis TaxID=106654 RepID=A0A2L1VIK0_ACINO|nr:hypothetical protein [Acinetobacter nosocomialis]AVF44967.1 hypothetical protein AL533_11495 [Acinetobacter nosocomialis]AWL19951.1 hypothetical protein DIW83_13405 [Acinetobacter nosocomialis]MBP1469989.1 hypothetical protein [Acinetobacter nosocomialis]MBP1500421.1 hypothetical protein [Acinetobacter nosocomialis]MBR7685359.1 hypothetical protein [Acinetobacter nosocomialis]
MNDFWKIILISSLLIQLGCSNRIYEQPSDKYPFEAKMKALLGDNLEIIDSINKYEAQVSYFEFTKDSRELEKIVRYLDKDGWVLKGKGQGVDTYCLGRNNRINVVIPTSGGLYDFKGGKLKRTDYSVNAVLYSYDKWGDDMCE